MTKRHLTPIVDLCQECNLKCLYCYAGSSFKSFSSRKEVNKKFEERLPSLHNFIDNIMYYNNYDQTVWVFHGGEACLIYPSNWYNILQHFKKNNYQAEISVQTNGTLITKEFINLFKEYDVKVGVSIDGPGSLNDETRIFKNGHGTFKTIFRNLERMKVSGLNYGCLVTINKSNMNMEVLYEFFKKYNIAFGIRPLSDTQYKVPKNLLITPHEYATSHNKLFDLWFYDKTQPPQIGDFYNAVARILKPNIAQKLTTCTFIKDCSSSFIAYDMEGNIWPCNCLTASKFNYGNIEQNKFADIVNVFNPNKLSLRWENLSNTECRNCEIQSQCYGGCGARAFDHFGSYFKKDPLCQAYRQIHRHVYDRVKSSIKN